MKTTLRPAEPFDFEFSFEAKRTALGPHVVARWGWDDQFQLELHKRRWLERPWRVIEAQRKPVGTVSVEVSEGRVRFGEFYLLPEVQGHGLGSKVLRFVLEEVDQVGLPVELEYLKWNPVGSLYKREGFAVVAENEIHYFMRRPPSEANPSIERTSLSWLRQPKAAAHVER